MSTLNNISNPFEIIPAKLDQIPEILMVIDAARQLMRESGNHTQWTNGYPSIHQIEQDINNKEAFVICHQNQIKGYFFLAIGENPEPTYTIIENGSWLNSKPYGVIHRLASDNSIKGIADAAFDFAFSKIDNIRVDTHGDNLPMQRYLKSRNFHYCGIIYVSDGTPRDAFMKTSV